MSKASVSSVLSITKDKNITFNDIKVTPDEELYYQFFPEKYQNE